MNENYYGAAARALFQKKPQHDMQPLKQPTAAARSYADGQAVSLPVDQLIDYPQNDIFHPASEDRVTEMTQDIAVNGIISPLIVRPLPDGTYQILAGHTRRRAAEQIGLTSVPCIVRYLDDDAARQLLISDNLLHRPDLLPSEKGFAYKAKADYANKQGQRTDLTSSQIGTKLEYQSGDIAEQTGDSRNQIYRFIRLTYLIRALRDIVDGNKLGLSPAVELSYMSKASQRLCYDFFFEHKEKDTPRLDGKLARTLRDMDADGTLDDAGLRQLIQKPLPNSRAPRKLKLDTKALKEFFPDCTGDEMIEKILFAVRTVYGNHD